VGHDLHERLGGKAETSGKVSSHRGAVVSDAYHEVSDVVTSGAWIEDCFFYTTPKGKLNYVIGGRTFLQTSIDKGYFISGYV